MSYTIGALASAAGVHVETVRYYQRRRLMTVPPSGSGRVRRYSADALERLQFIRRAQAMGFTLAEIATLLSLRQSGSCGKTRALATEKLAAVEARMRDLRKLRSELRAWLALCEKNPEQAPCPVMQKLARSGGSLSVRAR
jgi:MerR family mercuric resistance operon transcriptional regulator